jgi:hypothetical protein
VIATAWVAAAGAGMGAADIIEVSKQRAVTKRNVTGFRVDLFIHYGFDEYMPTGVPKFNILLTNGLYWNTPSQSSHSGTGFLEFGNCPWVG